MTNALGDFDAVLNDIAVLTFLANDNAVKILDVLMDGADAKSGVPSLEYHD